MRSLGRKALPLIVFCGVLVLQSETQGQSTKTTKPDFTGTWVLEKQNGSYEVSLIVEHNDPEVRITRKVRSTLRDFDEVATYYTDGRGEANQEGLELLKSKTKWDGDKLVFRSTKRLAPDLLTAKVARSEKWQLSKDGLLIQTVSFTVNGTANPSAIPGISGSYLKDVKRAFRRSQ